MWVFDASSLAGIAFRTLVIYAVVLVGIRLNGKREVGQMTPFDLVLLLLIANAVQNAMTGPDVTLSGGIVAAGVLLVTNALVARLAWWSKRARRFLEGTPTMFIHHGKVLIRNLEAEHISFQELHQALREHGVALVEDVQTAIMEVDGSISVLKHEEMPTVSRPHHRIRFMKKKT